MSLIYNRLHFDCLLGFQIFTSIYNPCETLHNYSDCFLGMLGRKTGMHISIHTWFRILVRRRTEVWCQMSLTRYWPYWIIQSGKVYKSTVKLQDVTKVVSVLVSVYPNRKKCYNHLAYQIFAQKVPQIY